MDIGYLVGLLLLPIVIVIVAIAMRLFNRRRPVKPKHYIIIYVVYTVLIGINMLIPMGEKAMAFVLAAIILGGGYFIDKTLKIE